MKNQKESNQTIVLEPSTNTHTMKGNIVKVDELPDLGGMVIEAKETCFVLHGEHGVIATENENIIKLVQQELNPITKKLQNSFD